MCHELDTEKYIYMKSKFIAGVGELQMLWGPGR